MNPFKGNKALRFLGSVKLALPMLLILAALLAAGTIVESLYSTAVARLFVYGTWWFSGFLMLLALNLFCSAFSHFPWKKHQTGFVITHLGIILILAGSFVTQQWGEDGQITLKEGEGGHVFQVEKPTLYWKINDNPIQSIPAFFPFRPPSGDHPFLQRLSGDGLLMVDQFYLNAQRTVQGRGAGNGEKGYPAIHLELQSSFVKEDQWLFLGSPEDSQLDLGPASVYFEKEEAWKKRFRKGTAGLSDNAWIILMDSDGSLKYQTRFQGEFTPTKKLEMGRDYAIGWMEMRFKISQRLSDGFPEEKYLSQPLARQKDPQPALHYEVLQGGITRQGWLGYPSAPVSFILSQGQTFMLFYGPEQMELPFQLRLAKFTVGFDPGTERPASYASYVLYGGADQTSQTPARISMNEPLRFMGYTVYQASYEVEPDGTFISVFSVGQDPGLWVKYTGTVVLVLGIVFMFWFKNPAWNKRETNE